MNINPVPPRACAHLFGKAMNPHAEHVNDKPHLPFIRRIPDHIRNHFIAMCGEFVGTFLFLFFALSGTHVAKNVPSSSGQKVPDNETNPEQLVYIALCFGFSLAVNAWVFFRISGGLFNPAVTFGMCLIGALPLVRGILLFFTQILGGMVAAALVECMFPGPLSVRTVLGGGTSTTQGLFIEMFLTAQLVFTICMLAAEKHKGTFIAPIGIGLALFIAELSGVCFTGGSLNPARSFGPSVVARTFTSYDWIYWLGPFLGSLIAAGFYKFIKILEYETANPGQDMDHPKVNEHDIEQMIKEKKKLLIAAGINEYDAHHVATELTQNTVPVPIAGLNIDTATTGHVSPSQLPSPTSTKHGSKYSPDLTVKEMRGSVSSDGTFVKQPLSTARPATEQPGKFTYLGSRGAVPRTGAQGPTLRPETTLHSPRMATNEDLYAPLETGPDVVLGEAVRDPKPIQRTERNSSSFV